MKEDLRAFKSFKEIEKLKIVMINMFLVGLIWLFFVFICPIAPYDSDDWIYLSYRRIPLPIWKGWEPTRILPEILMPLCGYISAYIVYPVVGDYFLSITLTTATILTMFILVLCVCFMLFLNKRFELSINLSLIYECIFLVLFWMIFRNRGTSKYMFYADNMCCVFFYTISGIVNAIAVLIMLRYDDFQKAFSNFNLLKKIGFVVLIYSAVFSNQFHSGTLAILCGLRLLDSLVKMLKEKNFSIRNYIRNHKIYFAILVLWLVAAVFELNGGRSDKVAGGKSLSLGIPLKQLSALIQAIAIPYKILFVAILCWVIYSIIFKKQDSKKEQNRMIIFVMANMLLLTVYLILLGGLVPYISRIEATWDLWFYLIVFTVIGIVSFTSQFPQIKTLFLPLLLGVGIFFAVYPDGRFQLSNAGQNSYATCVNVGNYVMDQIMEADAKGLDKVEVHVPAYTEENLKWIFGDNYGLLVADTLYAHNIIHTKMEVTSISDINLLEELKR